MLNGNLGAQRGVMSSTGNYYVLNWTLSVCSMGNYNVLNRHYWCAQWEVIICSTGYYRCAQWESIFGAPWEINGVHIVVVVNNIPNVKPSLSRVLSHMN